MIKPTNKLLYPLALFFSTLFIYVFFTGRFSFLFPVTVYNYFSFLAEAFLHGSLSFISSPPFLHDLTNAGGKLYMYWGPAPVLLILPLVLLFGKEVSDALYTALIASFNPLLLYLILSQLEKLKLISISNYQRILLCIFFAFGTVHFYLSIFGTVWFTSQVISIFYLLISLLCISKFTESKSLKILLVSGIFFWLAVNSRTTLVFYLPLFIFFYLKAFLDTGKVQSIVSGKLLPYSLAFIFIGVVVFLLNADYNYLRFGTFFENGYTFQNYASHFAIDKERYGFFNSAYIPKNFYYMLINLPVLTNKPPFLIFNTEGNSVLFTSPLFLILVLLSKRKYWETENSLLFNLSAFTGIILILLFLLFFWGTGWVQFGYRYLLDAIPLLILLLAVVIKGVPALLTMALLIFSILINTFGTLWFMGL